MPLLFGKRFTRRELESLLGHTSQLAGVRPVELADGPERGVRAFEFWTGAGLEFTVLADRALDIGATRFRGIPLAWRSPVGDAHPAYYEPQGLGWLRTFFGGLLITCGLDNVGTPGRDGHEELGLHGRFSHLPARNLSWGADWQKDEYALWVEGEIRQWRMFGENLVLRRRVATCLGSTEVSVHDSVTNEGSTPTPLMLLYHVNLGWPLLSPSSRIETRVRSVRPRDSRAAEGLATWGHFSAPVPGFQEQVYYLDLEPDGSGFVEVALVNPDLDNGLAFWVRYKVDQLPRFVLWKMLASREYVVGFEPANCLVEGRAAERARGTLRELEPGETAEFELSLGVATGPYRMATVDD